MDLGLIGQMIKADIILNLPHANLVDGKKELNLDLLINLIVSWYFASGECDESEVCKQITMLVNQQARALSRKHILKEPYTVRVSLCFSFSARKLRSFESRLELG